MKFCKNCGTEIADGIRFCPKCGADNIDPSILRAQEEALKNRPSFWQVNKKGIIAATVALLVILCAVGGGYYYHQQQVLAQQAAEEKAAQEAAKQAEEAKAAAEKAAQEKKLEEEQQKIKAGINAALEALAANDNELRGLENNINAGTYNYTYYSSIRNQIYDPIRNLKENIDEVMPDNDVATKNEVIALANMQESRADMLYRGIGSGPSNRGKYNYDAAHQIEEKYNQKLEEFKAKYGM